MRKAIIITAALALVTGMTFAGEYHTGATLVCSQCHTMHASLQHSYGGGVTGYPRSWTPTEYLLKGGLNETCLACHDDAGFAPDVIGNDTGPMLTDRSAGALSTVAGPVDGYEAWMGHTLGSTAVAPGDVGSFTPDATHGLTCMDCHHQHGYGGFGTQDVAGNPLSDTFRNLSAKGGISVSYAIATNDTTKDVFETTARTYETAAVNLNEPNATDSGFGEWCQKCHVNFHGDVGDSASIGGSGSPPAHFVRHPNATVNIGAVGGGHSSLGVYSGRLNRVRVMSPTGDWGTQGTAWTGAPGDLTPTCLSCHKAHGNKRAFGLIYALGASALGEDGDGSAARDLCTQCHVQGG
jgi:hypothetical protein